MRLARRNHQPTQERPSIVQRFPKPTHDLEVPNFYKGSMHHRNETMFTRVQQRNVWQADKSRLKRFQSHGAIATASRRI